VLAGGPATEGRQRNLDIAPAQLPPRGPVFVGSTAEVAVATARHREHDAAQAAQPVEA
jgi:fructose-1,6-bisphosphatase I